MSQDISAAAQQYLATRAAAHKQWLKERHAICSKQAHDTEKDARKALSRIRERDVDEVWVPIRVYPCPRCSLWHLTSTPLDAEGRPMREHFTS